MPRRPEIGNIQLYPDRPLRDSDKNGYVLKFYCPIKGKRIRKNCGTRNKRDARKILRECRERLLKGEYVASGGAITVEHERSTVRIATAAILECSNSRTWSAAMDDYYRHRKTRGRESSLNHAASRLSIAKRILDARRHDHGLSDEGLLDEYFTLESMEYLQDRLLEGAESNYDQRAPMTVNSMLSAVMAFGRHCHKHGWLKTVPPLSKLPVDEVMKGRPVTASEFQLMLDATKEVVGKKQADSWQRILHIIWESGFRVGDVMNFSWDDQTKIHPLWPQGEEHPTLVIPSSQKNKKNQQIPMLPGLAEILDQTPSEERRGWIVDPLPVEYGIRAKTPWIKPSIEELRGLVKSFNNSAIARACGVSETSVRKWLETAEIRRRSPSRRGEIPAEIIDQLRESNGEQASHPARRASKRTTKEHVGRVISLIGERAKVVVQDADESQGKRRKYASAHDLRRGCAQRLINTGVSAETLKIVMRHKDFKTTEKFYGAMREAQSAASEIYSKVKRENESFVGGLVGGTEKAPQLNAEELLKLKRLLNSL